MERRRRRRGFTLIELMIVVAIIGILAVLAVYGVQKYLTSTKKAEAINSLGQMGKDQSAEFEHESMAGLTLPPGTVAGFSRSLCLKPPATVPPNPGLIRGQKYQSSQAPNTDWNNGATTAGIGFPCLKFTMDAPQYYMYNFDVTTPTAAGGTWKGYANGDLNGDTILSTFELDGIIQPNMTFSLAPNVQQTNADE